MPETLADLIQAIGITPQTPQQRFYQRPRLPADALMQPGDVQPATPSQVGGYLIDRSLARHADQEAQRRAKIMQRSGVDPTDNAPRSLPQIGGDLATMLFEGTGLPSAKRAIQHTYNSMQMGVGDQSMDEARAGTSDALMAGLNVALMAGPHVLPELPARRLPAASVEEPATPLPQNPTRDLGYSNGSLLPVRPREPFRQSMVGGSADLAEAALPQRRSPQQQEPDARALGSETTYYRGVSDGRLETGFYSPNRKTASAYADRGEGAQVLDRRINTEGFREIPWSRDTFVEAVADADRRDLPGLIVHGVPDVNGPETQIYVRHGGRLVKVEPSNTPDGGAAHLDQLRAQGFDTQRQFYHGTDQDFDHFQGETWLSDAPARPNRQAMRGPNEGVGANVRPVFVRGNILQMPRDFSHTKLRPADIQRARDAGYDGIEVTAHDGSRNLLVFKPDNIAPRFGSASNAPARGGASFLQYAPADYYERLTPGQKAAAAKITRDDLYQEATVNPRDLVATQSDTDPTFAGRDSAIPPIAYRINGRLYLENGHHRALTALRRGDASIKIRIYDVDAASNPPNGGAGGAARPPDPDLPPRRRPRT